MTSSSSSDDIGSLCWLDDTHVDPQWMDQHVDPTSLDTELRGHKWRCISCIAQDISNPLRRGERVREGATLRLTVHYQQQQETNDKPTNKESESANTPRTMTMIVKQAATPKGRELSQKLGLAREALFYQHLAPLIQQHFYQDQSVATANKAIDEPILPHVYYAHGNYPTNGSKFLVMQDLPSAEYIDSGVLFGPGNPHNWDHPASRLDELVQKAGSPLPHEVAHDTFQVLARIHALYWQRIEWVESATYLRGHDWVFHSPASTDNTSDDKRQDQDEAFVGAPASWIASQQYIRDSWQSYLKREQELSSSSSSTDAKKDADSPNRIQWDPLVRAAVEKAVAGISWTAHAQRLHHQGPWTLVHGDFWPGNVLWKLPTSSTQEPTQRNGLRLVDFEMVGLGSGPQEIGQYVISHMSRDVRKEHEHVLLQQYYETLKTTYYEHRPFSPPQEANDNNNNTTDDLMLSWEECWREYTVGGVERWMWFLIYFCAMPASTSWAQFFHNQIADFMHDHDLTADDITQPRP